MDNLYYVYILKGKRFYVGYTNNLERRFKDHKRGHTYSTKRIGEFVLVGYFECLDKKEATGLEKKIKKSGHIERYVESEKFIKVMSA